MDQIQAIIFDADGMVIDVKEYYSQVYAKENNLDPELLAEFFDFEFQQCLVGEVDLIEEIKPYLKKWGVEENVEKYIKHWFESESTLNKDMVKTIRLLKQQRIPRYLMSNQEKHRAHYILETLGFNLLFDHSFFSYEMHYRKPEERAYRYVIDSLNYLEGIEDPASIMFWDDKEENVSIAAQVGLNAHLFRNVDQFKDTLASFDIKLE